MRQCCSLMQFLPLWERACSRWSVTMMRICRVNEALLRASRASPLPHLIVFISHFCRNYFTYIGHRRHVNDFSDVQVDSPIGASAIKCFFEGGRGFAVEQVQAGLYRMVSKPEKEQSGPAPLLIKLTYPRNPERTIGNISEELLIELELQSLDDEGQLVRRNYRIRFNPVEGGRFISAKQHFDSNVEMPLLGIDVMALELLQ